MFIYKHTETIEYVKNYYQGTNYQGTIYIYMNLNIWGDFQFCISVPLNKCYDRFSSFIKF